MTISQRIRARVGLLVLFSITACCPPSDNVIVGKWEELTGAERDEFRIDGTVTEKLHTGQTVNGTYSMVDRSHLKVKFDGAMGAMGEMTFPIAINGNTMTMTTASGDVIYYKRVR